MKSVLVLFAHPRLESSRVNIRLLAAARAVANVHICDLYEEYPDFDIDVPREQKRLREHDVLVLHHPIFWYAAPPLVKQWIDLVLEFGWAYGPGGNALDGKQVFQVVTSGGTEEAYQHEGRNKHTISEYLWPFEQTARLCRMDYGEVFVVHGTHQLSANEIEGHANRYQHFLRGLVHGNVIPD
ncbi:MAG: NAD(P)H-dependent oxidoreductase [Candidatus Kapabacteria bacterium]|jgi:glutathione-regulated potassium-efflux system ancillary protein KefG|nr:NAD(P)H-dependent oxidoreductase [Candidatus Kapabacteria bacterium]